MLFIKTYQVIFIILLFLANTAGALVIDDFNGEQQITSELETVQSNAVTLPQTSSQRLNSLGGKRKLLVEGLAGSKNIKTRLVVEDGKLIHSQDSGAIGISRIIWDGDDKTSTINNKLGAYNLIADGSSKIILEVLSFDAPFNSEVNLEIRIYNELKTIVVLRKNLKSAINSKQLIEFPLKDFIATDDSAGNFSFNKVSAIELQIDGLDQDIDLQLDKVRTDTCPILPDNNNQVVDACGMCNGNNSSCRDCLGVVNGKAKKDRCGVCNGDGQSCLGCTQTNQSLQLGKLDSGTKEVERLTRQIANKIISIKNTLQIQKFVSEQKKIASDLQIKSWQIVWQLPINSNTCSNQNFCAKQSVQGLILEYQKIANELKLINEKLITRLQKLLIAGSKEHLVFKRKNDSLNLQILAQLANIPINQSVCS